MKRRDFLGVLGSGAAGCAEARLLPPSDAVAQAAKAEDGVPREAPGRTIVILGAGFGGISTALALRAGLGSSHRVVLIDKRSTFMMGLRKQWLLTGTAQRADGERSIGTLRGKGIDVRRASVTAIDTRAQSVQTDGGPIAYDYLVVALGAEPRPDLVSGFSPAAFNMFDVDDVERARAPLGSITRGRIVIGVFGLPYKCPPAPYEAAMLLDDALRRRGVRADVDVQVLTSQPMTLPAAGKVPSDALAALLDERKIGLVLGCKGLRIEASRAVHDAGSLDADVLLVVPPHRPPAVVKESGLAAADWIEVEADTLRTTAPRVWAIGDVTQMKLANGGPFPKAGVFAEAHGRVVAAKIVAEVLGASEPGPVFDGRGYCFVETGRGEALAVEGEFLAAPAPNVTVTKPTADGYEKKLAFERDRLKAWFDS